MASVLTALNYNIFSCHRNPFCFKCSKPCLRQLKKGAVLLIIAFAILYFIGIINYLYEVDFNKFTYPYEGNIEGYVMELRENRKPSMASINEYKYNYLTDCKYKCSENTQLRLVILVKSAMPHFERRYVIRRTWGYENRFSDVEIRTVFLLGVGTDQKVQSKIDAEYSLYKDIVQANFTDSYYNNTIKTMMGFKWAVTKCSNSKFYMFVDDDMYVSIKNVLRYIRNPTKYPEYLSDSENVVNEGILHRKRRQLTDFDLPDGIRFYSGFAQKASPIRVIFSKWYMPLEEYAYDTYPLYATAGAYILSIDALIDMYYASMYTKHFRFDDVYLGILAHKIGIFPFHSNEIHLYKVRYVPENYKYLIASHGYENPEELLRVWNEQKESGNA